MSGYDSHYYSYRDQGVDDVSLYAFDGDISSSYSPGSVFPPEGLPSGMERQPSASSDGSYNCYTPASEAFSEEYPAYLCAGHDQSPSRSYSAVDDAAGADDEPRSQDSLDVHADEDSAGGDFTVCLFPQCASFVFRRKADLDRHYRHVHTGVPSEEAYPCDYPRCQRRDDPFGRRDHFRDHLRNYHREDVAKKGADLRLEDCNIDSRWWRCAKCLVRVPVDQGWECPRCSQKCQQSRRQARLQMASNSQSRRR